MDKAFEEGRTFTPPKAATPTRDAVDRVRLRGIPAIGGRDSIGGNLAHTRPDKLDLDRR